MIPDLFPPRTDYATAEGFSTLPMELGKLRRLSMMVIRAAGVPEWVGDEISGLYCARRVLPSVADISKADPQTKLDIGGWQDKALQSRLAMPHLYSEARLNVQANCKRELITLTCLAMINTFNDDLASSFPSWQEVYDHWPSLEERTKLMWTPVNSMQSQAKSEVAVSTKPAITEEEVADDDGSSGESTSSSENDSEAEGCKLFQADEFPEDAEDEPYPLCLTKVEWKMASGKTGHLHLCCGDSLECGRNLHRPEVGTGLSHALDTGRAWSPRCWAKLSPIAQSWWKSSNNL